MTTIEFNQMTDSLISIGILKIIRNGDKDELSYLFPYCENSFGREEGRDFNAYKLTPIFKNGKLVCIKISGLQNGAYTLKNIGSRDEFVTCIYYELMNKYNID